VWVEFEVNALRSNLVELRAESSIAAKLLHKVLHPAEKKKKSADDPKVVKCAFCKHHMATSAELEAYTAKLRAMVEGAADPEREAEVRLVLVRWGVVVVVCLKIAGLRTHPLKFTSRFKNVAPAEGTWGGGVMCDGMGRLRLRRARSALRAQSCPSSLPHQLEKRVALLPLAKACAADGVQRRELAARLDAAEQDCSDLASEQARLASAAKAAKPVAEQGDAAVAKLRDAERDLNKVASSHTSVYRCIRIYFRV
jgi:hypothetical protein